ncbi:hypothetical protein MLD38_034322 [Melastoma candidum]|uniref:Uncharacterized protein n=1 Tax=Melastoma candidum TaxID=119954 RepID=A0ACB9MA49_9MYRT|nr:hypothetical protein MLD38_034322 [Melastoma candidum]
MGACTSRPDVVDPSRTAKVISVNGELHEYLVPATVSLVLRSESAPPSGLFICNSDGLYYGERVQALAPGEELVRGQIYFVLPVSKLDGRLTAPEMAALAVKASLALRKVEERGAGRGGHRRRRGKDSMRITPVVEVYEEGGYQDNTTIRLDRGYSHDQIVNEGRGRNGNGGGSNKNKVARVGSLRRMTRVASTKRSKLGGRSFRMRLSTIQEGTVM